MSNGINPTEFGRLLESVDNIEKIVSDVQKEVRTQNSRVYKLEERATNIEKVVEMHRHETPPDKSIKERAMQYAPGATGAGVVIALVEVIKMLITK